MEQFQLLEDTINDYFNSLGWDVRISISPEGVISYPDYLNYAITGRAPGRMPPIEPIKHWIDKHRLNLNEWAVAKSIARDGVVSNFNINDLYDYVNVWIDKHSAYLSAQIINTIVE